jgi:hypothetical protein
LRRYLEGATEGDHAPFFDRRGEMTDTSYVCIEHPASGEKLPCYHYVRQRVFRLEWEIGGKEAHVHPVGG